MKNCSKIEVMLHPGKQKVFLILFSNVSEVRISWSKHICNQNDPAVAFMPVAKKYINADMMPRFLRRDECKNTTNY